MELVAVPERLPYEIGHEKLRAFQREREASFSQDGPVSGCIDVFSKRMRGVGADVHLLVPEEGAHRTAGKHVDHVEVRARVVAGLLAFPGVERSFEAVGPGFAFRSAERVDAVADETFGDCGVRREEIRGDEHLRIPENGALVGLARKSTGWDGQSLAMARRGDLELVQAVSERALRVRVAVDLHVSGFPYFVPARCMRGEEGVEAFLHSCSGPPAGETGDFRLGGRACCAVGVEVAGTCIAEVVSGCQYACNLEYDWFAWLKVER